MNRRWLNRIWLFLPLLAFLLVPSNAMAGGWATITVDEIPSDLAAGSPARIGFRVLQHGNKPMAGLKPTITFESVETGEPLVFEAAPEGPVGHYQASVALPHAGEWNWSIQAFTMDFPMPLLQVSTTGSVQAMAAPPVSSWLIPVAVLVGLIFMALLLWRRAGRTSARLAFLVIVVLVAAGGLAIWPAASTPLQTGDAKRAAGEPAVQAGQALFIAKGCTTCHVRSDLAPTYRENSIEIGPNLDQVTRTPEELGRWLADPSAEKPDTLMPDLDLSAGEIATLVSYLKSGP
jgi:cytochrome c2